MRNTTMSKDTNGAATELGYIFTFLLGVLLLSMFSMWAWDIETATRERWNQEAIQANMDDIASAVERADQASRMGDIEYSESIYWRATEADENQFTLTLSNELLSLQDGGGTLDMEVSISGAGSGEHTGTIELSGISTIWVVHSDGVTSLQLYRPQ
ncbi:MAG: hypothetical protein CBE08_003920 [Euryarchaeota archaeon TMED248]|nr:hypothetical protein [Euryarchaeota archaeon]RPG75306.1 MAG: hypothetical protein CBE08_003920 [Euryarchaeota archaeon TMED248]|tara:strand:+ start:22071 stop:22538 length:468 start_codon:yes stop_codon:yes gene_type:complete